MEDLIEKALTAYRIRKEANEGKEQRASGVANGEKIKLHLYWARGSWVVFASVGEDTTTIKIFNSYEEAVEVFEFIKGKYGMK